MPKVIVPVTGREFKKPIVGGDVHIRIADGFRRVADVRGRNAEAHDRMLSR
jgi:hypothetical protein